MKLGLMVTLFDGFILTMIALTFLAGFAVAMGISYALFWCMIWLAYQLFEWNGLFVVNESIPFFQWDILYAALLVALVRAIFFRKRNNMDD